VVYVTASVAVARRIVKLIEDETPAAPGAAAARSTAKVLAVELNEVEGAQDDLGLVAALAQPGEHGGGCARRTRGRSRRFLLSSATTY
jgi:hypothetical protein